MRTPDGHDDVPSPTEARNPRTTGIDTSDTVELLRLLHHEDALAVEAVASARPALADAVDHTLARMHDGGRVHYFGAGASGRLAMVDATETTPTFGVDPGLFTAHFPGGLPALADSRVDLEDAAEQGAADAEALTARDVAVGITASGATAYVAGALRRAHETGALTVLVTCNPASPLRERAQVSVVAHTGAEAIAGSTRLKAGTATKVILNAFSTALMVRSGRTYSNLMVGLRATNTKLRDRSVAVLTEATGEPAAVCHQMLAASGGEVPLALVRLLTGADDAAARRALARHTSVRDAVAALTGRRR